MDLSLSDEEMIQEITHSLEKYAMADIDNSWEQKRLIATFILCACFIDQLSHHRYFDIIKKPGKKFEAFITEYFPAQYDAESLCRDLRSRLVHNYSVTEKYSLSDGQPEFHLVTDEQGITWLNIDMFMLDIHEAYVKFKQEMTDRPEVRKAVLAHYRKYKIIRQKN